MTEKSRKYLSDVILAIDLIEEFTAESKNFNIYNQDKKTQSVVERQLVVIGEALNKLRQNDSEFAIENGQQIIGFRNRLVHAYDSIDNSIVWAIINRHLADLKKEVQILLTM